MTGTGYAPEGQILEGGKPVSNHADGDLRQLLIAAGLCNNARLVPPQAGAESTRWTVLGDPTEAALAVVAPKGGLDLQAEAQQSPRLRELPFDSRRKRMSTIHQVPNLRSRTQDRVAYVKGAPKEVLALCTRIRVDGQEQPLDDGLRAQIIDCQRRVCPQRATGAGHGHALAA